MLEENVAKAEKKAEKLQEQINELWDYQVDHEKSELTKRQIADLEDQSRRNNFRIDEKKRRNIKPGMNASNKFSHLSKTNWGLLKTL